MFAFQTARKLPKLSHAGLNLVAIAVLGITAATTHVNAELVLRIMISTIMPSGLVVESWFLLR